MWYPGVEISRHILVVGKYSYVLDPYPVSSGACPCPIAKQESILAGDKPLVDYIVPPPGSEFPMPPVPDLVAQVSSPLIRNGLIIGYFHRRCVY